MSVKSAQAVCDLILQTRDVAGGGWRPTYIQEDIFTILHTYITQNRFHEYYILISHKIVFLVQFNPDKCNENKRDKQAVQMVPPDEDTLRQN